MNQLHVLRESNDVPALIAYLSVRGVWQPQTVALIDVHVTDTNALSHVDKSVEAIHFLHTVSGWCVG